ncbi:hypothetical protein [uncultured Methanobrevibacter sp.]|uniref:hypothetical protein n=1 Tax=uncultured Methanobrevibacter sp. TaxID=253161 RepID=UPI0025DF5971|nr:hypothetical protein [uncultured Methanobrevibacter sp.]
MPFGPGGGRPFPYDYKETLNKVLMLVGIVIIIYAVLWILAELKLIPVIIYALFPQFVLLLIGIFIFYQAYSRRNLY